MIVFDSQKRLAMPKLQKVVARSACVGRAIRMTVLVTFLLRVPSLTSDVAMAHGTTRLDAPVVISAPAEVGARGPIVAGRKMAPWQRALLWGGIVGIVFVAGGIGFWKFHSAPPHLLPPEPIAASADPRPEGVVELNRARQTDAGIQVVTIQSGRLQLTRRVPGRVAHNANRVVAIRAPSGGVIQDVAVSVGDRVRGGQKLLTLSSSDVGLARDAVLHHESALRLAEKQFEWSRQTGLNVQELTHSFDVRPTMAQVEQLFAKKPLGLHREQILPAYSRLLLAEAGAEQLRAAENAGAVSQRLAQERRSEREVAAAGFRAVIEQSQFAAQQQQDRDRAAVEQAQRLLAISRERLAALAGPYGEAISLSVSRDTEYSSLTIHAPWNATVESRAVVASSNVVASDPLLTLVNLDSVWINAELYEQDYAALDLGQMQELNVVVPAVGGEPLRATVRFTDIGVSQQTQAIALVAELPNPQFRLRPGMFAWIELPAESKTNVLTVPPGAIVRQDGATFVFVAEGDEQFRRVDVSLGLETPEQVEILRGIAIGDRVVIAGTFTLKSELLLAVEPDEA